MSFIKCNCLRLILRYECTILTELFLVEISIFRSAHFLLIFAIGNLVSLMFLIHLRVVVRHLKVELFLFSDTCNCLYLHLMNKEASEMYWPGPTFNLC